MVLRKLGWIQEAIAKYKEAVERDEKGDMYATHNNLGMIYDTLYKDDQACEEFELATHDKSIHTAAAAYNNWGNVLLKLRRYNEALEKYHKSIEHDPNYAKAYYNRAYTIWQQGKHKEGRRAWKEALGVFIRKSTETKDTEYACQALYHCQD